MKKGFMRPVKKGVGILMAIMAAGFVFNIEIIKQFVMDCNIISIGTMILAAYFLIISGRRFD